MNYQKVMLSLVFILLASCASRPSVEQMQNEISDFKLESESSGDVVDVYIYYVHGSDNKELGDVAYSLDGENEYIGKLFYGEYFHFQTKPGKHTISWRGMGFKANTNKTGSLAVDFASGKTYIYRQVHATIFNRYADGGLSSITSLNPAEDYLSGKYYLSKTTESNITDSCLKKKENSILKKMCK